MKRVALKAVATVSIILLTSCTNNTSVADQTALATATASVGSRIKDAGGVVVKVGGSTARFNASLDAFEVGAGTASHYKVVDGSIYIDASVGDKEAYVEGTDENLKRLGVDPAQAKQDAVTMLLLMTLPGSLSSWSEGITSRVSLSDRTIRVTVQQDAIPNALAAGIRSSTNFFFTTGPDGSLIEWGFSDRPGAALKIMSYEEVSVVKPSDDAIVAVGSTP